MMTHDGSNVMIPTASAGSSILRDSSALFLENFGSMMLFSTNQTNVYSKIPPITTQKNTRAPRNCAGANQEPEKGLLKSGSIRFAQIRMPFKWGHAF